MIASSARSETATPEAAAIDEPQPTAAKPSQAPLPTLLPAFPTATLRPSATPAKSATPDPNAAGTIPGLKPTNVKAFLESRFRLVRASIDLTTHVLWTCDVKEKNYTLNGMFTSRSPGTVDWIWVGAIQDTDTGKNFGTDFIGYVATIPYDRAEPARARAWVEKTLPPLSDLKVGVTEKFGGVSFELFGSPKLRVLQIGTPPTGR